MSRSLSSQSGVIVLFLAALAGLAVALYAYFTPLTGVTGTLGALVVIVASTALAVLALIMPALKKRAPRNTLRVLILLGLAGICVAGLLLHQWWIGVAMAIGLVGLLVDMIRPAGMNRPAHP